MTLEQLQIIFYGIEAVALLLGLYALYEWGLYLISRLKANTISLSRAQAFFGISAVIVAFVPFAILSVFMRHQPEGEKLFDLGEAGTIFTMFGMLFLGFVLQGITIGLFWFFTRSYKK